MDKMDKICVLWIAFPWFFKKWVNISFQEILFIDYLPIHFTQVQNVLKDQIEFLWKFNPIKF